MASSMEAALTNACARPSDILAGVASPQTTAKASFSPSMIWSNAFLVMVLSPARPSVTRLGSRLRKRQYFNRLYIRSSTLTLRSIASARAARKTMCHPSQVDDGGPRHGYASAQLAWETRPHSPSERWCSASLLRFRPFRPGYTRTPGYGSRATCSSMKSRGNAISDIPISVNRFYRTSDEPSRVASPGNHNAGTNHG